MANLVEHWSKILINIINIIEAVLLFISIVTKNKMSIIFWGVYTLFYVVLHIAAIIYYKKL